MRHRAGRVERDAAVGDVDPAVVADRDVIEERRAQRREVDVPDPDDRIEWHVDRIRFWMTVIGIITIVYVVSDVAVRVFA